MKYLVIRQAEPIRCGSCGNAITEGMEYVMVPFRSVSGTIKGYPIHPGCERKDSAVMR